MAVSDTVFSSWPVSKQYLAAHYYLSEEKPITISEAQRAQLSSLHLFVSFGPYLNSSSIPELNKCTPSERKKRIEEWKALGTISRNTAMKKFIDILNCLFPNWPRYRKLHYEFEVEWANMQKTIGVGKSPIDLNPNELDPNTRKTVTRSLSPIQQSLRRPHKTTKDSNPKAVQAISLFQRSRVLPYLPRVPRLNAVNDASDTIYTLRKEYKVSSVHDINSESIYYRFPKNQVKKTEKKMSQDFFGNLLEEIMVDEKKPKDGGKQIMNENFPELDVLKNIKLHLSEMTNRLSDLEKLSV